MLISVVMPFYRELDLVGRAVDSVFSQTNLPEGVRLQVCIVNDGNIPNGRVAEAIEERYRADVLIDNNRFARGPGGGRNTGIEMSSGEVIAFLDADDMWLPNKVALQVAAMERGASFVSGAYQFENSSTIVMPPKTVRAPIDVFWQQGIGTSTVMVCRALIGDLRFHDFRFSQDIDFWYRIAQRAGFIYQSVTRPVTLYSAGGSTKNKLLQAKSFWIVLRQNHLPFHLSVAVLSRYAMRGVFNHYLSRGKLLLWPKD